MRNARTILLPLGALLLAVPAIAQQTTPDTSLQTTPTEPTQSPSTATPSPTGAPVSDADIDKFATAYVAIQKLNADTSVPATDKPAKLAEAVTAAGLTPETFNAIGTAVNADPALQVKVSAAVQAKGTPGAATPQ